MLVVLLEINVCFDKFFFYFTTIAEKHKHRRGWRSIRVVSVTLLKAANRDSAFFLFYNAEFNLTAASKDNAVSNVLSLLC